MTQTELLEELRGIRVIDTHEHFEHYMDTFGYTMPQFLYQCSGASIFSGNLEKRDVELLESSDASEWEQFQALLEIVPRLRWMRCGRSLLRISQKLGYELRAENYRALSESFQSRTKERVSAFAPKIEAYVCNSAGHPLFGGLRGLRDFADPDNKPDERMHRILNITVLHCIDTREKLEELEYAAGRPVKSLQEWERACREIITEGIAGGIVGYKELFPYFRPMEIGRPDPVRAEKEFAALLKGEKAGTGLLDYLMYRIYEMVSPTGKPVAVHTGALIETAQTAGGFYHYIGVMRDFPEISFDLLHLNYPRLEDYMMALKSCPNAYGNAAWTASADGEYCTRFIRQVLEVVSPERCCFFGGDKTCAGEAVEDALEQAEGVLAEGLCQLIKKGFLGKRDALEIAGLWLYENPKALYKL